MHPIDAFRRQLLAVPPTEAPLVSVSLDLRPGSLGTQPPASLILQQRITGGEVTEHEVRPGSAQSLATDRDRAAAAVAEAMAAGDDGLYFVGCAAEGVELSLATPSPFRNSVRVRNQPWMFSFELFAYRYGRPITLVKVDLHTFEAVRVHYGEVDETTGVDYGAHPLTRTAGRTRVERSSPASQASAEGRGFPGGHAKNRVEQIVEEHRAMFAREAAADLERFLGDDDFLLVGTVEARSQLLSHLSRATAARAHAEGNSLEGRTDITALADFAAELVAEQQRVAANDAFEHWTSGAVGERYVSGPEEVERYLDNGQLAEVVFHEAAVAHVGTAADARDQDGLGDDDRYERLVRKALGTSAELRFGDGPRLLTECRGVAGLRRY